MPHARLRFATGEPIEFALADVVAYGPPIAGFRAWLGAVFASRGGAYVIRFADGTVLPFRREELKRVRLTADGAECAFGEPPHQQMLPMREADVVSYGPEPDDVRAWLGRLAQGSGEAWVRLADGRELRFPIGDGPHVQIVD